MAQQDKNNLLYLYDLPETATSVKIAEVLKQKCEYELPHPAQFIKDPTKPFANAIVRITDPAKLDQCAEKLRYFELDSKQCRALKFDRDLLGANKQKLQETSVFVRNLPEELTAQQLHEEFSQFGEIKSLKISLNPDHTSRKYGFVSFTGPEAAQKCLQAYEGGQKYQVDKYQPKDKRDFRKVFNNIYVKNFPDSWTEEDLKKEFSEHGNIKSLIKIINTENNQPFAFICFEDPNSEDREYGPRCAAIAVKELHGKKIDENHTLYVKEALKKNEREIEKKKEMLRYKNSKKRCNLYVKNFPGNTTKEDLTTLFEQFGKIESIKVFHRNNNVAEEALYAFVCFEKPEAAFEAKQNLHNTNYHGRHLYINHYEVKELRKLQNEDFKDKADFQNYKKQTQNVTMDLLTSRPEILQLLQHLLSMVQPKLQSMYFNRNSQQRRYNPRNQGQPGGMPRPYQQQQRPMPGAPGMQQPMMRQPGMGMPPMGPMPQMMQPQGAFNQPPMMQGRPPAMMPPHIMAYNQGALRTMPAVSVQNPNYKTQVGEFIYEYVEKIAGDDFAPKITGMLIDLSIEEIIAYLRDYNLFEEKVRQALSLLTSQ